MSLEAIAALLGHKSLRMTLVYARIADRKVADEYFRVTEQVESLYTAEPPSCRSRQRVRGCAGYA
jgi:site-specific recombinase XerD